MLCGFLSPFALHESTYSFLKANPCVETKLIWIILPIVSDSIVSLMILLVSENLKLKLKNILHLSWFSNLFNFSISSIDTHGGFSQKIKQFEFFYIILI